MPTYEFNCDCGRILIDLIVEERDRPLDWECDVCHVPFTRVFSFTSPVMLHEHFNASVGKVISSHGQFRDELKRASDRAEDATGVKHNFVPVDPREVAHTVTDEGMQSTHDQAVKDGRKEPTKKVFG